MKRPLILTLLFFLLLIALIGCQKQDVFIKSNDELINSNNSKIIYHHLPENWYFTGDYSFRIGTVKGGGALLASDKDATFVKENKSLFADMDYQPWIRDDVILPDLCNDQVEIEIFLRKHGTCILEGQAKDEFIQWFQIYKNSETDFYDDAHTKLEGVISFENLDIQGLCYEIDFRIIQCDGAYIMVDNTNKTIVSFGQGSALYECVMRCLCRTQGDGSDKGTVLLSTFEKHDSILTCVKGTVLLTHALCQGDGSVDTFGSAWVSRVCQD